jgi:hypothetical protein
MMPSDLSRARWMYQPTTSNHDPNPPIPLEEPEIAGVGQPTVKRFGGVPNAYSNSSQGSKVY